jgi:prephenate dehydrogenase
MDKPKPRVAIVGLGLIGGSIGLALRQAEVTSAVVGHDKDRDANYQAKKIGAVDRTEWNLVSACEEADLVILSTPVGAIADTFKAIGPYLRPDCVVIDTATLKAPVLSWAAEILPDTVHFVGGDPIVGPASSGQGGLQAARADLFQKSLFCLVPSPTALEGAVKLVTDLVSILGAQPFFVDAAEHDGLMAAVDHLPAILGLALFEMASSQPAWRELRKVAGPAFEASTHLPSADPAAYGDLYAANRDNVVRWMEAFSDSLTSIRQALAENQLEELSGRFDRALQERNKWLEDRAQGLWAEGPRTDMPEKPSFLDTFLGSYWRKDRKKKGK